MMNPFISVKVNPFLVHSYLQHTTKPFISVKVKMSIVGLIKAINAYRYTNYSATLEYTTAHFETSSTSHLTVTKLSLES